MSAELEKRLSNNTITEQSNFTKCQLTVDKVLRVVRGIDKRWEKVRVCHNVAESINEVLHRQSISHCKSTSLLVKFH